MPRIRLLPDHLVSQIAAGEVVERPASVVKELVENSLDAGATEVAVELESGGKRRIVVSDDGCGMDRDDAVLAFDQHATSKIADFEDLERVGTLGFRGEALASVAAVARVELTTAETPGEGHKVRIEGGRVRVAEPAARPRGTTIEVASLFFNVPARRKFLKRPQTELRRCIEVVQGYALARPDVRFTVDHQGRRLLDLVPVGEREDKGLSGARERIAQIFGRELAQDLAPIENRTTRRGERIAGFVGSPETTRGRRLFVFVNRRLLRDRAILATFYRAVREMWKSDDFPALFLFLDLPPEDVDVNVHPQKAEVRFRDTRVTDRVGEALRHALEKVRGEEPAPLRTPHAPPSMPLAGQGVGQRGFGGEYDEPADGDRWRARWTPGRDASGAEEDFPPATEGPPFGPVGSDDRHLATASYRPLEERPVVPLSGRSGEPRPFRLLGQYKGTLILLEGPDGLYLIDQHVAHERILYERLRRDLAREATPSQNLLDPPLLELSKAESMTLAEIAPALEPHGFRLQPLSGNDLALAAVPAVLKVDEAEKLLRNLASQDVDDEDDPAALARQILDDLAASMACKAAVKMHHPLAPQEMENLVAELFRAEDPYACPHGRPIVLQMTDSDLERRFGRR